MARADHKPTFSAAGAGAESHEPREREKIFPELQRQAGENALAQADALLAFFQALPAAALASERVEYERIVKRHGRNDARSAALEHSLDALEHMEMQAQRGRARWARVLEMARLDGAALHGFVSDATGAPLPGLTVRVTAPRLRAEFTARTEQDGYFRLVLPEPEGQQASSNEKPELGQVLVLDRRDRRLHVDPIPLELHAGSAYREYRVTLASEPDDVKKAKNTARRADRK
jgi:hypothetical protein